MYCTTPLIMVTACGSITNVLLLKSLKSHSQKKNYEILFHTVHALIFNSISLKQRLIFFSIEINNFSDFLIIIESYNDVVFIAYIELINN